MDRLSILFLHHKNDDVTINNYSSIIKHNRGTKVIPLKDLASNGLPKSISVNCKTIDRGDLYWNCDSIIYDWVLTNKSKLNSNFYLILEYDTFCDCNFFTLLKEYFHYDICGAELVLKEDVGWSHFDFKTKDHFKDFLFGIRPFSGILIKKESLIIISEKALQLQKDNIELKTNNECRIGILSKICNLKIGSYSESIATELSCFRPLFNSKGLFYHPVKEVISFT